MWQNGSTGKGLKEVKEMFPWYLDELDQAKVVNTELNTVLEKIRNQFLYIISISISTKEEQRWPKARRKSEREIIYSIFAEDSKSGFA